MFKVEQLCVAYGDKIAVHNADLHVKKGELTVLLGPNGCGKSTLLKTMAGLLEPRAGEVYIDGTNIKALSRIEAAKKISYLPQSRNIPNLAAEKLILHGRFPYLKFPRKYRAEDEKIAEQAMERLGILDLMGKNVQEVSGGERQKIYLAMSVAQQTEIILMDEPTTYLDPDCQMKLWEMALELKGAGKTVLIVTHDILQALRFADRVIVMEKGSIMESGDASQVLPKLQEVFRIQIQQLGQYYVIA